MCLRALSQGPHLVRPVPLVRTRPARPPQLRARELGPETPGWGRRRPGRARPCDDDRPPPCSGTMEAAAEAGSDELHCVLEGKLWVGRAEAATSASAAPRLLALGISHVVNCTQDQQIVIIATVTANRFKLCINISLVSLDS